MTLVEVPLLYANYEPFYRKIMYSAIKNSYPILVANKTNKLVKASQWCLRRVRNQTGYFCFADFGGVFHLKIKIVKSAPKLWRPPIKGMIISKISFPDTPLATIKSLVILLPRPLIVSWLPFFPPPPPLIENSIEKYYYILKDQTT